MGPFFKSLQRMAFGSDLVNGHAETERLRNECLSSMLSVLEMQKDLEKITSNASSQMQYVNPLQGRGRPDNADKPWNTTGDFGMDIDLGASGSGMSDLPMSAMGGSSSHTPSVKDDKSSTSD